MKIKTIFKKMYLSWKTRNISFALFYLNRGHMGKAIIFLEKAANTQYCPPYLRVLQLRLYLTLDRIDCYYVTFKEVVDIVKADDFFSANDRDYLKKSLYDMHEYLSQEVEFPKEIEDIDISLFDNLDFDISEVRENYLQYFPAIE